MCSLGNRWKQWYQRRVRGGKLKQQVSKPLVTMFLFVLSLFVVQALCFNIGNNLIRTYTKYVDLPQNRTSAEREGWQTTGECNPALGVPYAYQSSDPSVDYPLTLYFTEAGQLAGTGIEVYGSVENSLLEAGFWIPSGNKQWHLSVTFRPKSELCSSVPSNNTFGDRLIINADTISRSLPVLEEDAISGGWFKGSCFYGMGYHYFYDLESAPNMSWQSKNLLPVVTMYNNGRIHAFFFASSTVQQGLLNAHWWEPIPLPNLLMCKNTCSPDCTFAGTALWSTFHVYLHDISEATCEGGCNQACCP
eukprot:TRINITY_DN266_c0_g1_i6.p1 TRINITY_DN266_c0_g1~~TRINITY_DN266_c0_g1_i6.p1  ORF type:complete len:305 (-),score=51.46 TRINITY_DN266_c0_g1_i6:115-1029(-)